jgi:16S rRNA (adenine1518-N6/adenine1519-N6)-dimethyltransferase
MTARDPFQHYLDLMAAAGFRPSSTLGQNFLLDPSLHRWLAEQAESGPTDVLVEIGVGLGFLTRELAPRAAKVVAVEIDARLLAIARHELRAVANIEWVAGDALGGPGGTLLPAIDAAAAAAPQGCRIVANLPYSVSGPLVAELTTMTTLPLCAILLVQKELAQRIAAPVGSADYGGLSATVQASFEVKVLRDVPPQVFRPRPKVTSSVLRLSRRAEPAPALRPAAARRQFAAFVRLLFQQRRKVLRTTLARAAAGIGATLPAEVGIDLGGRAEELGPDRLVACWQLLASR